MNLPRATDSLGEVKVFIRSGAYSNIYMEGFSDGEVYGYDNTYPIAYDKGFTDGSNELISVNWLSSFLSGFGSILDKNILGSIKLWHLVAFPLLLGAVFLIFKFIK